MIVLSLILILIFPGQVFPKAVEERPIEASKTTQIKSPNPNVIPEEMLSIFKYSQGTVNRTRTDPAKEEDEAALMERLEKQAKLTAQQYEPPVERSMAIEPNSFIFIFILPLLALTIICMELFIQKMNAKYPQSNSNNYAKPGYRIGAFIIDILLLNILVIPFIFLWLFRIPIIPSEKEINTASKVLGALVAWLYFSIMESSKYQASLGKLMFGIMVTDAHGERLTLGKAMLRAFFKILGPFSGPCFFLCLWTPKKQALHDILAKTLVMAKLNKTPLPSTHTYDNNRPHLTTVDHNP